MGFTVAHIREAAHRVANAAGAAADELNAQDAKLGDGDLGITVSRGWREVADAAAEFPDDIGMALLGCAKAFQRASPSSFGTLTATGLMSAAKATKGRAEVDWSEIATLLAGARDAMMARGKGALGDKSVLDMLDTLAEACSGSDDPLELRVRADEAATAALERFRELPSKLGRARMFGDKSVGLDDPGMLAARRMLDGLIASG